jgi:type IV secretory pathway VirD2 relaxase
MSRKSEEKEFRLRPRKPRASKTKNGGAVWATAFKLILHYARTSRKTTRGGSGSRSQLPSRPYFQRCAVRASYSRNTTPGQWRTHGRYLARESATFEQDPKGAGFDASGPGIDISGTLAGWQAAGDQRLWKIILSPEFGDRLSLERLTRDVLKQIAADVHSGLEWVAVAHHNTEHPHVHIAIRGRADKGQPLDLSREYVKQGIRAIAEECCTRQLGYRTMLDAVEASRREVNQRRFTSIDRALLSEARNDAPWFTVVRNPAKAGLGEADRLHAQHCAARLAFLESMGLAESAQPYTWRVRRDFESVLRAMQLVSDHQKTLAAFGVLKSDERLPISVLNWRETGSVEGRILVHGQDELSGRSYLMLEGTNANIHFIHYTPEMERARHQGELRTNSFVRLRRIFVDGDPLLETEDFGNAEKILQNPRVLAEAAQKLINRGIIPTEDGWGGWLGRYQAALREVALRLEQERKRAELTHRRERQRDRDRSRGR